jgi:hypothetical protein
MTTLQPSGTLQVDEAQLEHRLIGPRPDEAATIVLLHEGLGSLSQWGDFPDDLARATGTGVFAYCRAGYGASSPVALPRPLSYMHDEGLQVLPKVAPGSDRGDAGGDRGLRRPSPHRARRGATAARRVRPDEEE